MIVLNIGIFLVILVVCFGSGFIVGKHKKNK